MTTVDARVDADVPRESEAHETDPFHGVDFSKLERSLRKPRTFVSSALSGIATAMTVFALIPLFSNGRALLRARPGRNEADRGTHAGA